MQYIILQYAIILFFYFHIYFFTIYKLSFTLTVPFNRT